MIAQASPIALPLRAISPWSRQAWARRMRWVAPSNSMATSWCGSASATRAEMAVRRYWSARLRLAAYVLVGPRSGRGAAAGRGPRQPGYRPVWLWLEPAPASALAVLGQQSIERAGAALQLHDHGFHGGELGQIDGAQLLHSQVQLLHLVLEPAALLVEVLGAQCDRAFAAVQLGLEYRLERCSEASLPAEQAGYALRIGRHGLTELRLVEAHHAALVQGYAERLERQAAAAGQVAQLLLQAAHQGVSGERRRGLGRGVVAARRLQYRAYAVVRGDEGLERAFQRCVVRTDVQAEALARLGRGQCEVHPGHQVADRIGGGGALETVYPHPRIGCGDLFQ